MWHCFKIGFTLSKRPYFINVYLLGVQHSFSEFLLPANGGPAIIDEPINNFRKANESVRFSSPNKYIKIIDCNETIAELDNPNKMDNDTNDS